jgi:hypothetical protein
MYVNTNFAGVGHRDYVETCNCALSHTGYIITYCSHPSHWASKLQSEITLITTESECITLSMATGELLLLCHLAQEILHKHGPSTLPLDHSFFFTPLHKYSRKCFLHCAYLQKWYQASYQTPFIEMASLS